MRIKAGDTLLVIIDVQGKLALGMPNRDELFRNLRILIQGARELGIPLLVTEQVPSKLGTTVDSIREVLPECSPIEKATFSCWGSPEFVSAVKESKRGTIVLAGIETHVCVYQTADDLCEAGYRVEVVADAVASRTEKNREIALARMRAEGIGLVSVEMLLFQLMETAEHETFRSIARLVR